MLSCTEINIMMSSSVPAFSWYLRILEPNFQMLYLVIVLFIVCLLLSTITNVCVRDALDAWSLYPRTVKTIIFCFGVS